ncbi:response regulator transcription factor [Rheinheimera gaetbuli]
MPAILMIDDDTGLCELVEQYLALDGYEFSAAHDGRHGLEMATLGGYQLILLDIMLPGMDGLTVLKHLRANAQYCPVLMLTARGDDVDRIVGLELGADDYLAKPFNPRELVARIKAILRRVELTKSPAGGQTVFNLNNLQLNTANRQLSCNGQLVSLTATEFQLLEQLMRRAGEVVSKDELSQDVLGKRLQMYDRSLDMHISNIRKKLAQFSPDEKIQTLRGSGYLFIAGD